MNGMIDNRLRFVNKGDLDLDEAFEQANHCDVDMEDAG